MKTIEQSDFKNNAFHFLRFFAASLVIFDHAFPLYGYPTTGYYFLIELTGALALPIFFAISGFLITKSWIDRPDPIVYFWKRCLRILPALVVVTLFAILVIGPLATNMDLRTYFMSGQTWSYLFTCMLLIMTSLPGVFIHNPFPAAVNGSLWTLPYEFWMYIFIAIFGLAGLFSKYTRVIILIFSILMVVGAELFLTGILSPNIPFLHVYLASHFVELGTYFILGSLLYLYREKIKLNGWLAIVATALYLLPFKIPALEILHYITLPYIVVYFAFSVKNKTLKNFGNYGDFSYGIYIYAFLVQQILVYLFGKRISFLDFIILTFVLTFILAFISWNLVEKQAMKLKKINPHSFSAIFKRNKRIQESPSA